MFPSQPKASGLEIRKQILTQVLFPKDFEPSGLGKTLFGLEKW